MKSWIASKDTHFGRNLRQFVIDSAVKWGKGTKLAKRNPLPYEGWTAVLIACVRKDQAAGKPVDDALARYVERVSNGNS